VLRRRRSLGRWPIHRLSLGVDMIPVRMTHMQADRQTLKATPNLDTSRARIRSTMPNLNLNTQDIRRPQVSHINSIHRWASIRLNGKLHLLGTSVGINRLHRTNTSTQTMALLDLNMQESMLSRLQLSSRTGTTTITQIPHRQQGITRTPDHEG
jgi:hypothetical protein